MSKPSVLFPFAAIVIVACGSDPGSKYDYSKCGGPTAIVVQNADILDGDALALPAGIETDLVLRVTDAEGDLCDPEGLDLTFDDADQIEVVASGEDAILKPRRDAIDLGTEPTTVMRASLGELRASWTVASVVALGGAWNVTVTELTRFPDGYDFGEVTLLQLGRRLVWEDCAIPVVCARDAVVRGTSFSVEAPDIGLALAAPIEPDRRRIAGPWSASGYEGEFIAERVE